MDNTKPTQIRVYLGSEEHKVAEKLAKTIGSDTSWIVRRVVEEGFKAIAAKGCEEVTFPIRFKMESGRRAAA